MGEYLSFRKLITPALVQIVFWGAIIFNTIDALFGSHDFWGGLFYLVVGPILIRIICEGLIVIFEINNTLAEIRDGQRRAAVDAMFKPQDPSLTPPVV